MNDILLKALNDNNFDLVIENGDLKTGDNLKTAVYISLFTWARAKENYEVLEGNSKNGWWGDNLSDNHNIKIGSRLWLLKREKITQETINKAVEYSKQALQWMKDVNVVSEIEITAIRKENDRVELGVILYKKGSQPVNIRFNNFWNEIENGLC